MSKETTKLQDMLDRREFLEERSLDIENMLLKIRVRARPQTVKIGWFFDKAPKVLSWTDTDLFYEFLTLEKDKAYVEIEKINRRLEKLDKQL